MTAVKAALLPGLEFVRIADPRAEEHDAVARLAYRSVVLMGPHGTL